jgi:hypothetical protein
MTIHHSMTLTLGLPLVMKYRNLRELHLLTFNLQWAAALAIGANEYCKTLDLNDKQQLWTFRIMNGICFGIMAWMRGIYWLYLCFQLHTRLYDDGEYTMFCVGIVITILITGFNFILCIYPFGKNRKQGGGVCTSASNNSLMEKGE